MTTLAAPPQPRQPLPITLMRACLRHWPVVRGRGVLLRLFKRCLAGREWLMAVEPGVFVPAELDDYMVYWCFLGEHERNDAYRLSHALLRPGDVVLDVGANVGLWALAAARRVGPAGAVHAFEPVPDTFGRLTRNVALNGASGVRCRALAVADRPGRLTIYAATNGNSGGASLARREGAERPVEIAATTLDEYCRAESVGRVDFLKVDVEGAELRVFEGGRDLLAAADGPAVLFEACDRLAASFGSSTRAVKEFLVGLGYGIYRVEGQSLEAVPAAGDHDYEDLLALKPGHLARHAALRGAANA